MNLRQVFWFVVSVTFALSFLRYICVSFGMNGCFHAQTGRSVCDVADDDTSARLLGDSDIKSEHLVLAATIRTDEENVKVTWFL